jgi:hypothetical protein
VGIPTGQWFVLPNGVDQCSTGSRTNVPFFRGHEPSCHPFGGVFESGEERVLIEHVGKIDQSRGFKSYDCFARLLDSVSLYVKCFITLELVEKLRVDRFRCCCGSETLSLEVFVEIPRGVS